MFREWSYSTKCWESLSYTVQCRSWKYLPFVGNILKYTLKKKKKDKTHCTEWTQLKSTKQACFWISSEMFLMFKCRYHDLGIKHLFFLAVAFSLAICLGLFLGWVPYCLMTNWWVFSAALEQPRGRWLQQTERDCEEIVRQ